MVDIEITEDEGPGDGEDMHAVVELSQPTFSALIFDPDAHRNLVAEEGWSQEQEDAYLGALWSILVSFVDFGFRIHPTQQVLDGQNDLADPLSSVVDSVNISDSFNICTAARSPDHAPDRAAEQD